MAVFIVIVGGGNGKPDGNGKPVGDGNGKQVYRAMPNSNSDTCSAALAVVSD